MFFFSLGYIFLFLEFALSFNCIDIHCETHQGVGCGEGNRCAYPLLSCQENNKSYSCQKKSWEGDDCKVDADCYGGNLVCRNYVCVVNRFPGDACTKDIDCYHGRHTCDPTNFTCLGYHSGESCTYSGDCSPGLGCFRSQSGNHSICQKYKMIGETCNNTNNHEGCHPNLICNLMSNSKPKCTLPGTLRENALTSDQMLCQSFTRDSLTNRCVPFPNVANLGEVCNSSYDCVTNIADMYGQCSCTQFSSKNRKVCHHYNEISFMHFRDRDLLIPYLQCLVESPCTPGKTELADHMWVFPSQCIATHCKSKISAYWCKEKNEIEKVMKKPKPWGSNCIVKQDIERTYFKICPAKKTKSWIIIIAASIAIVGGIVLIFLSCLALYRCVYPREIDLVKFTSLQVEE